jgi:hypothetical protein
VVKGDWRSLVTLVTVTEGLAWLLDWLVEPLLVAGGFLGSIARDRDSLHVCTSELVNCIAGFSNICNCQFRVGGRIGGEAT